MWIPAWFAAFALAEPMPDDGPMSPDTAQGGVQLEEQRYARLDGGEGEPVRPRWRRRSSGDFLVWSRPDGVVQRALTSSRGHPALDQTFDLRGYPSVSVRYEDDAPVEATVHLAAPVTVDLAGWSTFLLHGASIRAPQAPTEETFAAGVGTLQVFTESPTDVYRDAFRDALAHACGCDVVERRAAWVDGTPGVRIRLAAQGPPPTESVEVWAVPRDDDTFVAAYTVPAGPDPDADLATGRVLMTLLRWAPPSDDADPGTIPP